MNIRTFAIVGVATVALGGCQITVQSAADAFQRLVNMANRTCPELTARITEAGVALDTIARRNVDLLPREWIRVAQEWCQAAAERAVEEAMAEAEAVAPVVEVE